MVNEACEYKSIMPWHKDWQHVEFLVTANSEPDAVFNSPDVQEAMRRSMRHVHAPSFELYCRNAVFMAMKHGMTPFHVDWIHVETIKKGIEQKPVFIYNKKLIHFHVCITGLEELPAGITVATRNAMKRACELLKPKKIVRHCMTRRCNVVYIPGNWAPVEGSKRRRHTWKNAHWCHQDRCSCE
jgi:hypothetical protein